MNLIKTILTSLLFFTIFQPLNASTTDIQKIKQEFKNIESNIKNGNYSTNKKSKEEDYGGKSAIIYFDKHHKIRKYMLEGGTGDSYSSAEYYYNKNGKLFFSFLKAANVHGIFREIRSYYKNGKLISRKIKSNTTTEINYYYRIKHPLEHFKKF